MAEDADWWPPRPGLSMWIELDQPVVALTVTPAGRIVAFLEDGTTRDVTDEFPGPEGLQ